MAAREAKRDKEGWLIEYDGHPVERISRLLEQTTVHIKNKAGTKLQVTEPKWVINIKGTNGSGKSTVPIHMLHAETEWCYLTVSRDDKKPVATYAKTYDVVILGAYLSGTNCGGCDYLSDTQEVKRILRALWRKDVHIIFEGIIVGDIKSTFYNMMNAFNTIHKRHISFCFMGTRYAECLKRIQRRNGGKEIKEDLVKSKYKNAVTHLKYYLEQGDVDVQVLKTDCTRQESFERFLSIYPALQPLF